MRAPQATDYGGAQEYQESDLGGCVFVLLGWVLIFLTVLGVYYITHNWQLP